MAPGLARTQVGIVGAGPAGLLLSHMLRREGIDSTVLEIRTREYLEGRVRAGVLEQGSVDTLIAAGVADRLKLEGVLHEGIEIRFNGAGHRIDLRAMSGGKCITVYGQREIVRDMIAARLAAGDPLHFDVAEVSLHDLDAERPSIRYVQDGERREIACDFIAGCDGFHGISRASIPPEKLTAYERVYPFCWIGIMAEAPPASDELIYTHHDRGFALLSMRSPTLSRLYLQCDPHDTLEEWPDDRVWAELQTRAATAAGDFRLAEGPVVQKGITPMRSFVVEPMQFGRLFLAGDAAHIVPPTGAKGMNLAIADVRRLSAALAAFYRTGATDQLEAYSSRCLRRVWKVQRFSWWMTTMLHRHADHSAFDHRRQIAEIDYVTGSEAAMRSLAENYVGLPLD